MRRSRKNIKIQNSPPIWVSTLKGQAVLDDVLDNPNWERAKDVQGTPLPPERVRLMSRKRTDSLYLVMLRIPWASRLSGWGPGILMPRACDQLRFPRRNLRPAGGA